MPITFDRDAYNKYDALSKDVMSDWLLRNQYKGIDTKETYGVDIICKDKDNIECYFETELKRGWYDTWPKSWKNIRIPYRKKKIIDKWMREGSLGSLTFVQFNEDLNYAWFMNGDTVHKSEVKPVDTFRKAAELFYHIKLPDAKLVTIKENTYDKDALINRKYPS
jgi:hypothetical protein